MTKKVKTLEITQSNETNITVAEKALMLVYPDARIQTRDLAQSQDGNCEVIIKFTTGTKSEVKQAGAIISWPHGQGRYGVVEIKQGNSTVRKFACWQDDNVPGFVSVARWNPLSYSDQCQDKFGIEWPQDKNGMGLRCILFNVVWCTVIFIVLALALLWAISWSLTVSADSFGIMIIGLGIGAFVMIVADRISISLWNDDVLESKHRAWNADRYAQGVGDVQPKASKAQ